MLPFLAAFKQISDAGVELLDFVQIVSRKIGRRKNRYELGIEIQSGVGSQVRGDFQRLILQDESACRLQRVIVRNRQLNGLIQSDQRLGLCLAYAREQQQAGQSCQAGHPEVWWTHKPQNLKCWALEQESLGRRLDFPAASISALPSVRPS